MNKQIIKQFLILAYILTGLNCFAQHTGLKTQRSLLQLIDKKLSDADKQYQFFARQIPADRLPRTLEKEGKLTTSGPDWWCSGFYPGTLFYLYQATHDKVLYAEATDKLTLLKKEQYNKNTHDLGFMMYCSYGNALKIKSDVQYREILINSARSLASRFDPKVGCIRSWNSKPADFLVIIDNMMNLELLFWATKATGDSSFYKIAITHANTTMRNHFRADYSSYHQVNYNPQTGVPQQKRTVQGAADSSAWARGQAWGLYGFTVMYRETKDKKYLDQANHIAHFILTNPTLPKDKIPYWDFDAPGIPNALRDASAGAVMASALVELAAFNKGNSNGQQYLDAAAVMIRSLSSSNYFAAYGSNGGFILKHSVGNMPGNGEVDVPLTYADYYFVEAMLRYKNLMRN